MRCPWCKEEMGVVSVYGMVQTAAYRLGEDGKYHETNFDESNPDEVWYCGNCGRELPERTVIEILKLIEEVR